MTKPAAAESWWAKRWIGALEKLGDEYPNRLLRGRSYARAGRVKDLRVSPGKVNALVQGSRPKPYRVRIEMRPIAPGGWQRVVAGLVREAGFAAQLLAGEMPERIDEPFERCGVKLFPVEAAEVRTFCSCPDVANPCKHVAATHYVLGAAFDRDPFLLFEIRGRTKEQVMEMLRQARGRRVRSDPPAAPTDPMAGVTDENFLSARGNLLGLRLRPEAPEEAAAVLHALGAPKSWTAESPPVAFLEETYKLTSAFALAIALAERSSSKSASTAPPPPPEPTEAENPT